MTRMASLILALALPLAACSADDRVPAESSSDTPPPVAAASTPPTAPAAAPAPRLAQAPVEQPAAPDDASSPFRLGEHYQRLTPAQPTSTSPEQVEVAEFFMFTCPHCASFEPYLKRWQAKQSADVRLLRVPVNFNNVAGLHQRAFYAAEVLGVEDAVYQDFFDEIHVRRNMMGDEDALVAFFAKHGVDETKFSETMRSFAVDTKTRTAQTLAQRFAIRSVPTVIVNGKYRTDGSMAGNYPTLMQVIDYLVERERGTAATPAAPEASGTEG